MVGGQVLLQMMGTDFFLQIRKVPFARGRKEKKNSIINNSSKTLEKKNSSNINEVGMITRVQKIRKKCVFRQMPEKTAFETKNSIYAISPEIIVFNPEFKRFLIFVSLAKKGK